MKGAKIKDLWYVNQIPRWARQFADIGIVVKHVNPARFLVTLLSDASLANFNDRKTQAGFLAGATDLDFLDGKEAAYTPFCWKSYKMGLTSAATLHSESQAALRGLSRLGWVAHLLGEAFTSVQSSAVTADPGLREG